MPQDFQVVRCFSCETFQVQQVKKSNKWQCKLCGSSQSVKKVFGQGIAKDCRNHVQQLNLKRKAVDAMVATNLENNIEDTVCSDDLSGNVTQFQTKVISESRWSCFLNTPDTNSRLDDDKEAAINVNDVVQPSEKFVTLCHSNRRFAPYERRHQSRDRYGHSQYQQVMTSSVKQQQQAAYCDVDRALPCNDVLSEVHPVDQAVPLSKWSLDTDEIVKCRLTTALANCSSHVPVDTNSYSLINEQSNFVKRRPSDDTKNTKNSVSINTKLENIFVVSDDDLDDILGS